MDTIIEKYPSLKRSDELQRLIRTQDNCDTYDYLAAIACGAIGGLVDIFLVGAPGEGVLGKWTEAQTDKAVMSFARKMGWNPRPSNIDNVNSAIGFLERGSEKSGFSGFKVNYDQRLTSDVGNVFKIAPKTHHMMSLAHSPDLIGLFFSILNQFTSTSSFIADGQLITIKTGTFELQGGNFLMRIMCGITNWFGHLMSDIAGSSGSHDRGTGIVMPFYELFGMCKFGSFGSDKKDLAEVAMQAFSESGYDFRFAIAQTIPVIITELSIRLIWSLRQYFQYGKALKDCIPTSQHANLRVMLLIGNGTLCLLDGTDAVIRSAANGGNILVLFTRLNLVAWCHLAILVIKEVCIRIGISDSLQNIIDAYRRINNALSDYLKKLEQIDIDFFKEETEKYNQLIQLLKDADSEIQLNEVLLQFYDVHDLVKPWQGDFNEHMSNKNGTLVFE